MSKNKKTLYNKQNIFVYSLESERLTKISSKKDNCSLILTFNVGGHMLAISHSHDNIYFFWYFSRWNVKNPVLASLLPSSTNKYQIKNDEKKNRNDCSNAWASHWRLWRFLVDWTSIDFFFLEVNCVELTHEVNFHINLYLFSFCFCCVFCFDVKNWKVLLFFIADFLHVIKYLYLRVSCSLCCNQKWES